MMEFDAGKYTDALETFLIRMEQAPGLDHPIAKEAMSGICDVLRIAEVEAVLYDNPGKAACGRGDHLVLFSREIADTDRKYVQREQIQNGNVVDYIVCQYMGDTCWTDVEQEKIKIFLKMVFTFNGRVRLMHIAERLTFWDKDLGIHNLNFFMKQCGMLIAQKRIAGYGACYFNLKNFSIVNRQLGRLKGTSVMKAFVENLQDRLGEEEFIGRIGGDNFIALFKKEHRNVMVKYLQGQGIVYDEHTGERIFVSATAGFYIVPENHQLQDPTDIMDRVSIAANIAKNAVDTDVVFFEENLLEKQAEEKNISSLFPEALEKREFKVYYQPKIALQDYHLAGAEALCRWQHEGKMISPNEFIPVLEHGLDICKLDFYMLDQVCRDIRRWLDAGKAVVKVSVNFSRRHLSDMDLLEHILEVVDSHRVPHEYIEIELTETTTDVEFKDLKRIVFGLQEQGISTSVDDFGIGYSSLNLIREIPWNVLKIDKSFLPVDVNEENQTNVMLKYVIAMAQSMGLECIVEGVETIEQVELLKNNNCYLAQGFYFDKPLPVEEFEERLFRCEKEEIE